MGGGPPNSNPPFFDIIAGPRHARSGSPRKLRRSWGGHAVPRIAVTCHRSPESAGQARRCVADLGVDPRLRMQRLHEADLPPGLELLAPGAMSSVRCCLPLRRRLRAAGGRACSCRCCRAAFSPGARAWLDVVLLLGLLGWCCRCAPSWSAWAPRAPRIAGAGAAALPCPHPDVASGMTGPHAAARLSPPGVPSSRAPRWPAPRSFRVGSRQPDRAGKPHHNVR